MNQHLMLVVKNLYTMERLGVMQISAMACQAGWRTRLLVTDALSYRQIGEAIRDFSPAILAFSVMSPEFPYMDRLARKLHQDFGIFTLFGGSHPTFFPGIIQSPHIQAVACGEADRSFPAFLRAFQAGESFTGIPGMHFHRPEGVIQNPHALLVEDLDTLPFPDRSLEANGVPLHRLSRSHIFMASRGCPNQCTYCFNHKYNQLFKECGKIIRRRGVDHLLREMKEVRDRYGMDFAYIDDDIFTLCSAEWLQEFARRYPEELGVPFMVNVHVNFVREEHLDLLKTAGCELICFGIECGDEAVSNELLKRRIRNEDILRLSGWLHERRFRFMTQNILALPVEHPLAADLQTLDLNIRSRPHYSVAHIFFPLPGTDLAEYCQTRGFYQPRAANLPERTNSFSALRFSSRREKVQVQRLHKLFGLAVNFPWLRRLLPLLIRLPLGHLYSLVFVMWYGFSMRYRLENTKKSWRESFYFIRSLVQSVASFFRRTDAYGD